jgi:hypothetical protein
MPISREHAQVPVNVMPMQTIAHGDTLTRREKQA